MSPPPKYKPSESSLSRKNGQRAFKAQGLANLMPQLTRTLSGKRPTLISDLKTNWPAIVGCDLAKFTRPGYLRAGTLMVEMALGAGPIVALQQADILSKVQIYLGTVSVLRLSLRQADFPLIDVDSIQDPLIPTKDSLTLNQKSAKPHHDVQGALARLKMELERVRKP